MCGIAGACFWDDPPAMVDLERVVHSMTEALRHRGPDGWGVVRVSGAPGTGGPKVVFGHRRLAIIDLSSRAAQPMANDARDTWVTFNGEVYDFQASRRALEAAGQVFRSDSDTEVVLRGYDVWGASVTSRLRGMFAAGIWDGRRQELLLLRDRLGIKPLYVWTTDRGVLFASEVRALLASGLVPRRLDPIAVEQYLATQAVPSPRTLVDGVRLIEPGHLLRIGRHGAETDETYWDLIDAAGASRVTSDPVEARARVRDLLVEAVGLHLVSDVPVGVFLSGGIDSSAIAALVQETGQRPSTFTVTLGGHASDEGPDARAIAASIGSDHHEIALAPGDVRQQVAEALDHMDQPSGDAVNTFIVSRAVQSAGLKVALSGLGGDELFGGYPSFRRAERLSGMVRPWFRSPRPARRAAAAMVRQLGGSSVAVSKTAAILETDGALAETFPVFRELFSERQRRELLGDGNAAGADASPPYRDLIAAAEARAGRLDLAALVTFAEARTYMHDVLLRDTDQMSMSCGLEVRVPLLDHELVEYVTGLPASTKAGSGMKPLLVESLGDTLPAAVRRQGKRGFVLPFDDWMRADLRALCESHLQGDGTTRVGLRPSAVRDLWATFLSRDNQTTWSRPWALVALTAWAERHGMER